MRIVIDGRLILPAMTGIGRYLLNLIPALARIAAGERIEVWLQKSLPADHPAWRLVIPQADRRAEVTVRSVPYTHMSLAGMARLPFDLPRAHADLLHYPHFDLPPLTPGPVVSTLHDLKYIARPGFFVSNGRIKRMLIRFIARNTVQRSGRIITVSEYTAADARRLLSADPARLRVIPSGVDRRFFQPAAPGEAARIRTRYGLSEAYILYVGERRPHKNLPGLIQAFARFRSMAPRPFQLAIVGQGYSGYRAPEKLVEHLGLGAAVRFIDDLPDADLPAVYRAASACALLSLYEGFGLPVLEAMASGVPVMASNQTALPEVCGDAALLVPPEDPHQAAQALLDAACHAEIRAELIQRGRERVQAYTWEACAARTYAVYREAVGGRALVQHE